MYKEIIDVKENYWIAVVRFLFGHLLAWSRHVFIGFFKVVSGWFMLFAWAPIFTLVLTFSVSVILHGRMNLAGKSGILKYREAVLKSIGK